MQSIQGGGFSRNPEMGRALVSRTRRTAFILGLAFIGLLLIFHLPMIRELVFEQLTERVGAGTGLTVACNGLWWIPFGGMHVKDLEVSSAAGRALSCPEAVIDFGLSLSSRGLVITEIHLSKPVLQLQKEKGRWVLFRASAGKREPHGAKEGDRRPEEPSRQTAAHGINVSIRSGVITAEQDGIRVLEVKDVNGSLVIGREGEVSAPFLNLDAHKARK